MFAFAVGILALLAVRLGQWQFDRLEDRERGNAYIRENIAQTPAPVGDVLSTTERLPESREWMRVRAVGEYDVDATVVLRYQTRDGRSGVDVVTPLVTEDGTALLVNRGWVPADNDGSASDLPAPPTGEVEVLGWARADSTGRGTDVDNGSTRAISTAKIGETVDYPIYQGFVEVEQETPAPAEAPARTELPDLGAGPHFFYGIQWWFFAALALFGFGYLAWDERRGPKKRVEATD